MNTCKWHNYESDKCMIFNQECIGQYFKSVSCEKAFEQKCFGEWLDTCFKGYSKCRICLVLRECKEKFLRDCDI